MGNPDSKKICTSHVERQNLSIRMGMRRLTRLTNAFSKKWENLWHAYCPWFAFYNFCRIHKACALRPPWKRDRWAGVGNRRLAQRMNWLHNLNRNEYERLDRKGQAARRGNTPRTREESGNRNS